jgi:hypothetical protein
VLEELWCFSCVTPVVPNKAKDEAGKAIHFRFTTDYPGDIKYSFPSGVECRMFRIIPDVAGRVTDLPRLFSLIPCRSRSYPGRSLITPDVYRGSARALSGCNLSGNNFSAFFLSGKKYSAFYLDYSQNNRENAVANMSASLWLSFCV